jgi:type IV secretory pathway TrbD component
MTTIGLLFATALIFGGYRMVAVALLAGSFGYALAVGLLTWIGLDFGFLVWVIGIIAGIILAMVVHMFNIQKYAIIAITAFGGAGAVILILLASVRGYIPLELSNSPVLTAITDSFWWLIFFLVVGIAGVVVQLGVNRSYMIEEYNLYAE